MDTKTMEEDKWSEENGPKEDEAVAESHVYSETTLGIALGFWSPEEYYVRNKKVPSSSLLVLMLSY